MGINLTKNHRTAVFLRRNPGDTESYAERVAAVVSSLNRKPNVSSGGTIKADIYSVLGRNVVPGNVEPTEGTPATGPKPIDPVLAAQAKAAGYDLVAQPSKPAVPGNYEQGRIDSPTLRAAAKEAGYEVVVVVSTVTDA